MRAFAARLAPEGCILLWPAFDAPAFAALAEVTGFTVTRSALAAIRRPDLLHYAYVLEPDSKQG